MDDLILHPRPLRQIINMVLAAFGLSFFCMLLDGGQKWIGGIGLVFMVLVLLFTALRLFPALYHLRLTQEGFHVRFLHRDTFWRWDQVQSFEVRRKGREGLVEFSPVGLQDSQGQVPVLRLPDTYGQKAQDLCQLLNDWRTGCVRRPDDLA